LFLLIPHRNPIRAAIDEFARAESGIYCLESKDFRLVHQVPAEFPLESYADPPVRIIPIAASSSPTHPQRGYLRLR